MSMTSKLALGIAAALTLTACGGGGSSSSSSDADSSTTVSGRAADGYLAEARVFIDLNGNGSLDSDEPNTTTNGEGFFTLETTSTAAQIIVEAIANLTVDLDTNQPVPKAFTLKAPIDTNRSDQFVSPITTMVSNEMAKGGGVTLEQAKETVATRLGTSFDVMEDFVAAKQNNADSQVQQTAERLHRVAQVVARVTALIEDQVGQAELDQLGITKNELIALINTQIEALVPVILADVDSSLGDPNFDPDAVVESPDYAVEPPSSQEPSNPNTAAELDQRIADATLENPFFTPTQDGFDVNSNGASNYLDFYAHPSLAGKFIFDGVETSVMTATGEGAALSTREYFPLNGSNGIERGFINSDNDNYYVLDLGVNTFDTSTMEQNVIGYRDSVPDIGGMITSTAYNGQIESRASYSAIDLSGLNVKDVAALLYPDLANALGSVSDSAVFPADSTAYSREETLSNSVFSTIWRGGNGFEGCDSTATPAELEGCNTLHGEASDPNTTPTSPVATFDGLTYPATADNNDHDAAVGFTQDGTEYYMVLYGDKVDGTGEIRVFDPVNGEVSNGMPVPVGTGTWVLESQPFEHVRLNMPDGIYYQSFQDDRGGDGYAYLHEFKDYLRAGRYTPADTNVAAYFERNPETFLLNSAAANQVLAKLDEWDLLAEHPGFSTPE